MRGWGCVTTVVLCVVNEEERYLRTTADSRAVCFVKAKSQENSV
jgi:hypothetical protein